MSINEQTIDKAMEHSEPGEDDSMSSIADRVLESAVSLALGEEAGGSPPVADAVVPEPNQQQQQRQQQQQGGNTKAPPATCKVVARKHSSMDESAPGTAIATYPERSESSSAVQRPRRTSTSDTSAASMATAAAAAAATTGEESSSGPMRFSLLIDEKSSAEWKSLDDISHQTRASNSGVGATVAIMTAEVVDSSTTREQRDRDEDQSQRTSGESNTHNTNMAVAHETQWFQHQVKLSLPWCMCIFGVMVLLIVGLSAALIWSITTTTTSERNPVAFPTSSPSLAPSVDPVSLTTLEAVRLDGKLRCGVRERSGFAFQDEGFEIDLCRAIAAGIFGPDYKVEYVYVATSDRFSRLLAEEFDVLPGLVTHNMEREVREASTSQSFAFSVPYLYNGLHFAGLPEYVACAEQLNTTGAICSGLRICVTAGSYVSTLNTLFPGKGLIVSENFEDQVVAFSSGFCDVMAGESFDIAEVVIREAGIDGEWLVGKNTFSKEPIAVLTRQGDAEWSDFVNWVVQALLSAEEEGITQFNAATFPVSPYYGTAFQDAIAAVGNYGQIYAKHLETIVPRADVNGVNVGTTPLIYPLPFGNTNVIGIPSETLDAIRKNGLLRCGITLAPGFAELNQGVLSGMDIDFCRALSAAVFSGSPDSVSFVNLPSSLRFEALHEGTVDVLAAVTTINMERDVLESSTGKGAEFTVPYYYDGLTFGGAPEFVECAESFNTAGACAEMKICIEAGSTFASIIIEQFGESFTFPNPSFDGMAVNFVRGDCNVVSGGTLDITGFPELGGGFDIEFVVGTGKFSKDPLGLVTRETDPTWSSFVNWVVISTMYAEEIGITQREGEKMPLQFLFGPLYTRVFRDVIQAVGNYAEMYERNIEPISSRGGLNTLNQSPFGPQHYTNPGFGFD